MFEKTIEKLEFDASMFRRYIEDETGTIPQSSKAYYRRRAEECDNAVDALRVHSALRNESSMRLLVRHMPELTRTINTEVRHG